MSDDLDDLIRRVDPDRWLSSRFIGDAGARADVIAIYAYDHELARAPRVASNPLLGEIRLTWWREALDEIYEGRHVRHHPTAQALAGVVERRSLPRELLEEMIDARYRELDATPMAEDEAMNWARETGGWAASLASHILDDTSPPEHAVAAGTLWMLRRKFESRPDLRIAIGRMMSAAMIDARFMSVAAFPAVAHATLVMRPAKTEIGKRLRLMWAVARGRL